MEAGPPLSRKRAATQSLETPGGIPPSGSPRVRLSRAVADRNWFPCTTFGGIIDRAARLLGQGKRAGLPWKIRPASCSSTRSAPLHREGWTVAWLGPRGVKLGISAPAKIRPRVSRVLDGRNGAEVGNTSRQVLVEDTQKLQGEPLQSAARRTPARCLGSVPSLPFDREVSPKCRPSLVNVVFSAETRPSSNECASCNDRPPSTVLTACAAGNPRCLRGDGWPAEKRMHRCACERWTDSRSDGVGIVRARGRVEKRDESGPSEKINRKVRGSCIEDRG